MADRRSNASLLLGVTVSIIVHLTVLVPLLLMAMTTTPPSISLQADLPNEELAAPEEKPQREEPELGIDKGSPSSVSWIGYEEYEEHLAQLAEFDQAAFTRDPSGAMGTQDAPDPMTVEEMREDASVDANVIEQPASALEGDEMVSESAPVEAEEELSSAPEPVEMVTLPEPALPHLVLDDLPDSLIEPEAAEPDQDADLPAITESDIVEGEPDEPAEAVEEVNVGEDEVAEVPTDIRENEVTIEEAEPDGTRVHDEANEAAQEQLADEADEQSDGQESEPRETASDGSVSDEQQERESQPQRDTPPGEVRDGEEADKDSDATSIIDVPRDNWRLGRPLAAKGVEIKPERPHFTLLQLTTASPRNPVVGLRFNRQGKPDEATVLRSTGDRSIDAAIIASLYRWRAEGEAIKTLGEDETFDITIRIVLMQRRSSDDDD